MRGRVNIDDYVAAAIERLRRGRGVGISKAVNLMARAGLRRRPARTPFRQRSAKIGLTVDVATSPRRWRTWTVRRLLMLIDANLLLYAVRRPRS